MAVLLIGTPKRSWRGWLKDHGEGRPLVCLDPADHLQPRPAQLTCLVNNEARSWRFYGSCDGYRSPHVLLAAAVRLGEAAGRDALFQAPAFRPGPIARQTLLLLAEVIRPDRILIDSSSELSPDGFTVGPESVELEDGFPPIVVSAQRKARWMGFLEEASEQEISLDRLSIEGARLGSGRPVSRPDLQRYLPSAVHAELSGRTLFVVSNEPLPDSEASRALDAFHMSRLHTATAEEYANTVCSLARGAGEDFALGIIRKLDFERGVVILDSDAVPPAPATILRLGSLRVDSHGNEAAESTPWSL